MTESVDRLKPDDVEVWLFDLDNTLYPASCQLFPQIERRMRGFIQNLLSVDADEAHAVQKRYFRRYGTTMHGLMTHHAVDPRTFWPSSTRSTSRRSSRARRWPPRSTRCPAAS